jgi:hypothetical protein
MSHITINRQGDTQCLRLKNQKFRKITHIHFYYISSIKMGIFTILMSYFMHILL